MPTPANPATSWLDIIPPIPLAHGVHVRTSDGGLGIVLAVDDSDHTAWVQYAPPAGRFSANGEWRLWSELRVDIDRAQGFAYAARYHYQQISHPNIAEVPMPPAQREAQLRVLAWLVGDVTDADRLALATALAEVSR